jgi:SAM-dependent methyltransferase
MNTTSVRHRADELITFRCNICDQQNESRLGQLTREDPSCSRCGSTVRMRSIVQVLTTELFGRSLSISEIQPARPEVVGIGMSCWDGYAIPLAHHITYKNTFYHQEPRLDIIHIEPSMEGTLDFVVSTDVFEHVEPPVSVAFENVRKLLKPDGVFIFSVPFTHPGEEWVPTQEHFPDLYNYELQETADGHRLKNTTRDGEVQYFDNLVFHGGPGSTLEMRVFSEWSILNELKNAGFHDITIYSGSDLPHGVYWPNKWSVPLSARVNSSDAAKRPSIPENGRRALPRGGVKGILRRAWSFGRRRIRIH